MNSSLRKLAVLFSRKGALNSRCEACGKEFSCGASLYGCWCSEIQLNDKTRAELRSRYRDCLCRDCLELLSGDNGKTTIPDSS